MLCGTAQLRAPDLWTYGNPCLEWGWPPRTQALSHKVLFLGGHCHFGYHRCISNLKPTLGSFSSLDLSCTALDQWKSSEGTTICQLVTHRPYPAKHQVQNKRLCHRQQPALCRPRWGQQEQPLSRSWHSAGKAHGCSLPLPPSTTHIHGPFPLSPMMPLFGEVILFTETEGQDGNLEQRVGGSSAQLLESLVIQQSVLTI